MRIVFLGDIALFGCFNINENKKVRDNLKEISQYLAGFDLVVGNLESPFSAKKKTWGAKSAYLCSDVENVEVLKWLHIGIVNLANNHIFDYGKEGYETTKKLLDKVGIKYFGTEGKTVDVIMGNNRLRFSGYCCYSTNPLKLAEKQGGYGVNKYNVQDVKSSLKKTNEDGFLNIVSAHVGLEHINYPSLDHIRAARMLADVCPYVYYGHHPHVIQGVEEYKDSLIAHSLGNFCFDDVYNDNSVDTPLIELTDNNRTGMILELKIDNNQVIEWQEHIIYISKDGIIHLVNGDNDLEEYNSKLVHCEDNCQEYEASRQVSINERLSERKANRNFRWFVKRLKPRYAQLLLDMRKNNKLYSESVKKYL